jgi:aldehyde dehydrogenase (NAD+)
MSSSAAAKSALQEFLNNTRSLFIAGRWKQAQADHSIETLDPGTGQAIAELADAGEKDVDSAVAAARSAFQTSGWAQMPPNERGVYLHKLADLIVRELDPLSEIESLDVGKPRAQAHWDIQFSAATIRYYADLALHTSYRAPIPVPGHEASMFRTPYGVCGFIFPWNFPFLLLGWGIAPALAAGNTVVIKPAEDTSLSTLFFTRLVKEAGIPDGVLNVITGRGETAGAALSKHPGLNRMSFTGSPEVGRMVAQACGYNLVPVKLELGGKGAALVFDDADIDTAVDKLVGAVTLNAGQVCCTATRWLVHSKVFDRFTDRALELMKGIKVGYGGDESTEMGPVVNAKQKSRVLGYIDKAIQEGASILLEGGEAHVSGRDGFYVKPAVLAGSPDNIAAREEIFGPVPFLIKFETEAEAIEVVNRSRYGLANSVWSQDLNRARRVAERLVAGNSWINAHNVFVLGVPYGGVNLSGLGGGVLGPDTLFDYLRNQSIVRPT